MLRECPYSISFWNQLSPPSGLYTSFGLPFSDWMHVNFTFILVFQHHGIPWPTLFLFGLWSIQTNRNCATFQARQPKQQLLKECVAKAPEFHFLTALNKPIRARPWLIAKWSKPPPGWHKLNTNASIINDHAGAGGLLCDSNGNWVQRFSKPVGTTLVLMAELWALQEGLRMAKPLNIHNLVVNVDSSDVVRLITSLSSRLTQPLVAKCSDILQAFHWVQLTHCFKEANQAADYVGCIIFLIALVVAPLM